MTAGLLLLWAVAQAAAWGESKWMTWNIDGVERQAIVYSPTAKTASGKAPLVLAFHGHGDTAGNFQGVALQEHWTLPHVAAGCRSCVCCGGAPGCGAGHTCGA